MLTKTYKAETMLEALQMVQAEMGPDAIVLSARESSESAAWGLFKRPGVEVVAAPSGPLNAVLNKNQTAAAAPAVAAGVSLQEGAGQAGWTGMNAPGKTTAWQPRRVSREEALQAAQPAAVKTEQPAARKPSDETIKALASVLEAVKSAHGTPPADGVAMEAPQPKGKAVEIPAPLRKLRQHLLEQGVEEAVLERVFKVALEMFSTASLQNEDVCRKYVQKLLEAELREQGANSLTTAKRLVCLVGMSGSGKTSATAKLALLFSQKLGRKVAWVCADTLRPGAIAEARAYCDALGIAFSVAYTPADLRESAAAASEQADMVLVDMPGYNPFVEEQMVELGQMLTELANRTTYFVAPANLKDSDLNRAAAALGILGLDGVILTKLDETYSYGSAYNFARKSQLPLGYFASGKGAEGALQAGTTTRLVSSLFGKGWNK